MSADMSSPSAAVAASAAAVGGGGGGADEGDLSEAVLRAKAFSAYESGNYAELYRIIQVRIMRPANQSILTHYFLAVSGF